MFEKPQYLTPDGYRRSIKNPENRKKNIRNRAPGKELLAKNTLPIKTQPKNLQKGISPEAAKLIAQAIKGFLKE